MASDLKTRLVFAPLLVALVVCAYLADVYIGAGGRLAAAVLGATAVAGVTEYAVLLRRAELPVAYWLLPLFTAAMCGSALFFRGWQELDRELYPLVLGTMLLLFPIAVRSLSRERMRRGLEEQGATLLGFVWIAWPMFLAQGMAIRHLPAVLFVVAVCKVGDIGAYLTGIAFGQHKLIPHVSKGKTVEGAVGSAVASCAAAAALRSWMVPPEFAVGLTGALAVGIMLNICAQVGDLIESLLKRSCGAKDSSGLLPAHGGVLDLIDSLLFSFPVYFMILVSLTGAPRGT